VDDKDSFAEPVKEKKHFDQVLDELVANGLEEGVRYSHSKIEELIATESVLTDYNFDSIKAEMKPTKVYQSVRLFQKSLFIHFRVRIQSSRLFDGKLTWSLMQWTRTLWNYLQVNFFLVYFTR
jgi:hypothetical protein